MAKKFINEAPDCVEEMVQGILAVHSDRMVRLEGYHVLLHKDITTLKSAQVTLLSGGGTPKSSRVIFFCACGAYTGSFDSGTLQSPSIYALR